MHNASEMQAALEEAFFPSAPIKSSEFFLGRLDQIERACDAINTSGQHLMIFGERGVGKTSFANILNTKLVNVTTSKVTCSSDDSFRTLWQKALQRIKFVRNVNGVGFSPSPIQETIQMDIFLKDEENIESTHIQDIFERVESNLLFIFDEFDSLSGTNIPSRFAQLVKSLSDNSQNVTIALVGVASSVSSLIGVHPSLERCLKQIQMPRMSKSELAQIVDKGLSRIGMAMDSRVQSRIVSFSSGFPHFTHLLAKFSCKEAIRNDSYVVSDSHYRAAIDHALRDVSQSIRDDYQRATADPKQKKSRFERVLLAAALTEEDEFGAFGTRDLIEPFSRLTGEKVRAADLSYNVQRLCEGARGCVLERSNEVRSAVRYRFSNPLMKVYLKMRLEKEKGEAQPQLFS